MTADEILGRLEDPINGFRLESLLRPDKRIAVIIDDHTRPTPSADILRYLFDIFDRCGIPKTNITLLVAIGTHILEKKSFLRKKLGDILDKDYKIVIPDCRNTRELVLVGISKTGIPVYINRHYAAADIKIAVSGIYPHDEAGFSGGAKILIGVLGLETLSRFHRKYGLIQRGMHIETNFRKELEHFADLAKLDYSVNCIINENKEIIELCCGGFREAFRSAAVRAKDLLWTEPDPEADVVIANAYPLDTAACVLGKSKWPFKFSKAGSFKILLTALCDCPTGRISLCSDRNEWLLQKLKRVSGASKIKQIVKRAISLCRYLLDPKRKWQQEAVLFVAHIDSGTSRKPKLLDNFNVEYEWQNIINDVIDKFGDDYPVKVSIYPYAPLLFPKAH